MLGVKNLEKDIQIKPKGRNIRDEALKALLSMRLKNILLLGMGVPSIFIYPIVLFC